MGNYLKFNYYTKGLYQEICQEKQDALWDRCSLDELRAVYECYKLENKIQAPLVSVLIATYKTNKKYLKECILSVLNQTYPHFELLIWDDGSEDETLKKAIESFNDPRIFYYQNTKNMGISKTRNKLIQQARGKYFAVMDHDDIMFPERLERQVIYMELNPTVGICGTAYQRFGNWLKRGKVFPLKSSSEIKACLFFKCSMHHPSVMIRADILRREKITYNRHYISVNDRHLYLDMMKHADFHNLQQVLMLYRMHAQSTSKRKQQEIQNEQKHLHDEMLEKMNLKLSQDELKILNDYVLKGRCRIKTKATLIQVESVLSKINQANEITSYFPKEAFSKICAQHLIKRCLNAMLYGGISSFYLIKKTDLPVCQVRQHLILRLFNFLFHL